MTDYMVTGLAKKRAEIAGDIERTHQSLAKLVDDLAHIDATLAIIAPDMHVEAIRPKVFRPPDDWSKRGEMGRFVMSVLRSARQPLTTREIAAQLVLERGIPVTDTVLRTMTRRVASCLRDKRDRGLAASSPGPGFHQLWVIVR